LTGSVCNNMDVVSYYTSMTMSSCDSWYQTYMPEMCSNLGLSFDPYGQYDNLNNYYINSFEDAPGIVDWTNSLENPSCNSYRRLGHGQDYGSNCRRRLSHVVELSTFASTDGIDVRPVIRDAMYLEYDSNDGSYTSANADYTPVSMQVSGTYATFLDFGDLGGDGSTELDFPALGEAMVTTAHTKLTENHAGRVSLLSSALKGLVDDSAGEATVTIFAFFAEFLHHVANIYQSSSGSTNERLDIIPIFPLCDPEFEESLTRDNIQLKNVNSDLANLDVHPERQLAESENSNSGGACILGPNMKASTTARLAQERNFGMESSRFWW